MFEKTQVYTKTIAVNRCKRNRVTIIITGTLTTNVKIKLFVSTTQISLSFLCRNNFLVYKPIDKQNNWLFIYCLFLISTSFVAMSPKCVFVETIWITFNVSKSIVIEIFGLKWEYLTVIIPSRKWTYRKAFTSVLQWRVTTVSFYLVNITQCTLFP